MKRKNLARRKSWLRSRTRTAPYEANPQFGEQRMLACSYFTFFMRRCLRLFAVVHGFRYFRLLHFWRIRAYQVLGCLIYFLFTQSCHQYFISHRHRRNIGFYLKRCPYACQPFNYATANTTGKYVSARSFSFDLCLACTSYVFHKSSWRITSPCTSVRRRSMPLWRKVRRLWSMPSRCRTVAWMS